MKSIARTKPKHVHTHPPVNNKRHRNLVMPGPGVASIATRASSPHFFWAHKILP